MTRSSLLVLAYAFDPERGGGSVRIAFDLADALARRGHEVTVIAEDVFRTGREVEMYGAMKVLRYRLGSPGGALVPRYLAHGLAVRRLARRHLLGPPAAVHGHNPFQFAAAVPLFKNRSRLCFTVHSPTAMEVGIVWKGQGLKGKLKAAAGGLELIRRRELACLTQADRILALSKYTRSLIEMEYGEASADRVRIIPGWTDTERFHPIPEGLRQEARRRFGWPPNVPVLAVVRRLEARMGLEALLRAIRIVRDAGVDLFTVVAGSGSLRDRLVKTASDLGVQNLVRFSGFVPGEDLPTLYGAADLSMIPTEALEGFGLIALEAMACGLPVLVTPVGALPELVQGFEPSWVAEGKTPEDLADILLRQLRGKLPHRASALLHEQVVSRYSISKGVDAYEQELFG